MPNNKFSITTRWLMAVAAFYNILALWLMSGWTNTNGTILGRYSLGIAGAMMLLLVVTVFWIAISLFFWQQFNAIIQRVPQKFLLAFLLIIACFFLWWLQQTFRIELMTIIAVNLIFLSGSIILNLEDKPVSMKAIQWLLLMLILFVLVITFISAMIDRPYNPDEAIWGDRATALLVEGKLYGRVGLYEAYRIEPGRGWITAIYSFFLGQFGYDLQIGRTIQFVWYTLTIGAIGLWGTRLYNYRVGIVAMLIAFFGRIYYPIADYRTDHFVALGQMLAFSALVSARKSPNVRTQIILHFLTGLLITLSMQLHAIALVYIIALSLIYSGDFVWTVWRERRLSAESLRPIISFGLGALLGTIVYYLFNVLPVGGLDVYLAVLGKEHGSERHMLSIYRWQEIELALMFMGLAYLLWRRSNEDKLYLALIICSILGMYVDTQGYSIPYRGLFVVSMALVLVEGFKHLAEQATWHLRQVAIIFMVLMALLGQRFNFVDWDVVQQVMREGRIPQHNSVAFAYGVIEHLEDEDWNRVLVGTQELIWALEGHNQFYSPKAEGYTKTQRGWEGTDVWDFLQPDVYIEALTRLDTPPGLRAYLEREAFQVCEEFNSVGYPVSIYRRECPEN